MCNSILSSELCSIMKDRIISTTQKFILIAILCESFEHDMPDVVELPVRIMESYGIRGHGHIKGHLSQLQEVGYLLEVGTIQREDGYVVTAVRINKNFQQRTHHDLDIFPTDSKELEDRREA